jgi:hypothetical protein
MGNKTSKLKRKQKNTEGKKKKSLPSPNNVDNGQVPEVICKSSFNQLKTTYILSYELEVVKKIKYIL